MTNGDRPRHPNKDLEACLRQIEAGGWHVRKVRSGLFKLYCSCGDHMMSFHLTPSNPNYGKERVRQCRRTCWKEDY